MSFEIRRLTAADAPALWEAGVESVEAVYPWMPWCHPGLTLEEVAAYIEWTREAWEQDQTYSFGIFEAETGTHVGGIGLSHVERGNELANLFYWVRSSYAGRGAATAATRLIARFAFEELGLRRVEIVVAVSNHASQRVAEKAGATREGVLRKRVLVHGESHDGVMYSLIDEDLQAPGQSV